MGMQTVRWIFVKQAWRLKSSQRSNLSHWAADGVVICKTDRRFLDIGEDQLGSIAYFI